MILDFKDIKEKIIPNFNGGEKEFKANMYVDDLNKIMMGTLIKGASIGMHTHTTSSEIQYILKGIATFKIVDEEGKENIEIVKEGQVHYCKKGCSHTLINNEDSDLVFLGIVPNQ